MHTLKFDDGPGDALSATGLAAALQGPREALAKMAPARIALSAGVRIADALVLYGMALATSQVTQASGHQPQDASALFSLMAVLTCLCIIAEQGLYGFEALRQPRRHMARLAMAPAVAAGLLCMVLSLVATRDLPTLRWTIVWASLSAGSLVICRMALAGQIARWLANGRLRHHVAVVGAGPAAAEVVRWFEAHYGPAIEIVGVFDDRRVIQLAPKERQPASLLGAMADLIGPGRPKRIDTIVVAVPHSDRARLDRICNMLQGSASNVALAMCPALQGHHHSSSRREPTGRGDDMLLLPLGARPMQEWSAVQKAIFDLAITIPLLLALAPILVVIGALIKLETRGPALFRQQRIGLDCRAFEIFKFRSMHHERADPNGDRLTTRDDPRVTKIGRVLRRTSLDELPQLLNVLRGEMSLVGPRPHALGAKVGDQLYFEVVSDYMRRHRVRPGITGWAQVNGWRGETLTSRQIEQRVAHDLHYIENWSLALDCRIMALTVMREIGSHHAF